MMECTPQELLPIMPPRVQRSCVAGSGAKVRWCFSAAARRCVEDDSGLDAGDAAVGIDFKDIRHVLREVEDDGGVATLSGERGAASAGEQRSAMFAAKGDGSDDVFFVARDDDADRNLAIVRAIGGVESAAAGVEADFSAKMAAEGGFEDSGIELSGRLREMGRYSAGA